MPAVSPYYSPGAGWAQNRPVEILQRHIDFQAIPTLCADAPEFVVGAINITDGTFETFTNEEVTVDAVLASAAVPRWFRAVEIDGSQYWGGLFSQKPPITDLLSVPSEQTPDELWVIQINPQTWAEMPTTLSEIDDRRNELAGNILLHQELGFVEWINEKTDSGHLDHPDYRPADIERIELSDYRYATKADRSRRFLEQLTAEGQIRAKQFLETRNAR